MLMPDRDDRYYHCFEQGKQAATDKFSLTSNPYVSLDGDDHDMMAWIDGFRSVTDTTPSDVTFVRYDAPGATAVVGSKSNDDEPSLVT
jgi:hypothetical protein